MFFTNHHCFNDFNIVESVKLYVNPAQFIFIFLDEKETLSVDSLSVEDYSSNYDSDVYTKGPMMSLSTMEREINDTSDRYANHNGIADDDNDAISTVLQDGGSFFKSYFIYLYN